jgi:eukaryotic-like serine/threonine-protein kinase
VRIADFGFAIKEDSKELGQEIEEDVICGTPGYIAPEALEGKGYTRKSDIFSLGSILYNILSLKNLFAGKNHKAVMQKNEECELDHVEYYLRRNTP